MHKSQTLQSHAFVKHQQSPLFLGSQATYPQMYLLHPRYQVCLDVNCMDLEDLGTP